MTNPPHKFLQPEKGLRSCRIAKSGSDLPIRTEGARELGSDLPIRTEWGARELGSDLPIRTEQEEALAELTNPHAPSGLPTVHRPHKQNHSAIPSNFSFAANMSARCLSFSARCLSFSARRLSKSLSNCALSARCLSPFAFLPNAW